MNYEDYPKMSAGGIGAIGGFCNGVPFPSVPRMDLRGSYYDDARDEVVFSTNAVQLAPTVVMDEPPKSDPVHRPAHYARFKIEPITFIVANELPYMVGNVIKYICRFDAKDGDQDIRKAIRYCEMILEQRKREREGTAADVVGRPL